jgi:hypothetical protein
LAPEFIKKKNWRPDRLLKWASKNGLNIKQKELTEHLAYVNRSLNDPDQTNLPKEKMPDENRVESPKTKINIPAISTDEQFLNLVIENIHDGVAARQVDLKVEHAFKAIELKQKLAESGNVENLLLELLNEIRKQELAK